MYQSTKSIYKKIHFFRLESVRPQNRLRWLQVSLRGPIVKLIYFVLSYDVEAQ